MMESHKPLSLDAESLSSSTSSAMGSVDPIYQYQTRDGCVKTRKFNHVLRSGSRDAKKATFFPATTSSKTVVFVVMAIALLLVVGTTTVYIIVHNKQSPATDKVVLTESDLTTPGTINRVVTIGGSVTISKLQKNDIDFSPAFDDPESTEYRTVERLFVNFIDNAYADSDFSQLYDRTEVTGFSAGSLVVHFKTYFNLPASNISPETTDTADDTARQPYLLAERIKDEIEEGRFSEDFDFKRGSLAFDDVSEATVPFSTEPSRTATPPDHTTLRSPTTEASRRSTTVSSQHRSSSTSDAFDPHTSHDPSTVQTTQAQLPTEFQSGLLTRPPSTKKECKADTCKNGGSCVEATGGVRCKCRVTFGGDWCEIELDRQGSSRCTFNPCKNGGTCFEDSTGYKCFCPDDWLGTDCSIERPICSPVTDVEICSNLVEYTHTSFPNYLGMSRDGAVEFLTALEQALAADNCHPDAVFFYCAILAPKCDQAGFHLPCRGLCQNIRDSCSDSFRDALGREWLVNCDVLPENGGPDLACGTSLANTTDSPGCQDISSPICDPLKPYGGGLQRQARGNVDDEMIPTVSGEVGGVLDRMATYDGCHEYVDVFMCSLLAPECNDVGSSSRPCRQFCEEVEGACRGIMESGGTVWPVECSTLPEDTGCIAITACATHPCQNEATCVPLDNTYACICAAGWNGVNCTENIDDCDPNPCENGGTCIDGVGSYTCACDGQWSGTHCNCKDITIEECRNLPYKAYSPAVGGTLFQSDDEFRRFLSSTRPYTGCFPYIDVFMCSLFAPECTVGGNYRPPCRAFCEAAQEYCEPQFVANGISWPIDCSYLPDSLDPATCLGREYAITDSSAICGTRTLSVGARDRIVGGRSAEAGEWPWQVALYIDGSVQCGGSIINENWILTAAHCVKDVSPSGLMAVMGVTDLRDTTSSYRADRPLSEIHIHPDYNEVLADNDLALLKLVDPLEFNDYVRPVCLPPPVDNGIVAGLWCTTTGWGLTADGGQGSTTLMEAGLTVIEQGICQTLHAPAMVTDSMICAGAGSVDACLGDSGGPLVYHSEDGRWYQAGVTSWGVGCGNAEKPGVYSRVTTALDWVAQVTDIGCGNDEYTCNTGECVSQTSVCNDVMDCPNGEDEDADLCGQESECEEFLVLEASTEVTIPVPLDQSSCVWKVSSDSEIMVTLGTAPDLRYTFRFGTGDDEFDNTSVIFEQDFFTVLPAAIVTRSNSVWVRFDTINGVAETPGDLATLSTTNAQGSGCQDAIPDFLLECGPNESLCFSSDQGKILCDHKNDCGDWADEMDCSCHITAGLRCYDGGPCIFRTNVCDGDVNCPGGVDEVDCEAFHCNNGHIVPRALVCDGVNDCGDKSDERGQTCSCSQNEVACNDGTCINKNYICDGIENCAEGEDELNCDEKCMSWQLRCADGTCIPHWKNCDHVPDCPDGSDEENCSRCFPNEFVCGDFDCVGQGARCNGILECSDFSDEINCTCDDDELFLCDSGFCISIYNRCDGYPHCLDASDEENCESFIPPCGGHHSLGGNNTSVSLSSPATVDGVYPNDVTCVWTVEMADDYAGPEYLRVEFLHMQTEACCDALFVGAGADAGNMSTLIGVYAGYAALDFTFNGRLLWFKFRTDTSVKDVGFSLTVRLSDPEECIDGFPCNNAKCIAGGHTCDGVDDCGDGTDEDTTTICSTECAEWQFQCDDGQCIPLVYQCNGVDDCFDGSDEDCAEACTEFTCEDTGECVPSENRCDGIDDCDDGSDEDSCTKIQDYDEAASDVLHVNIRSTWYPVCKDTGGSIAGDTVLSTYGHLVCRTSLGFQDMQSLDFYNITDNQSHGFAVAYTTFYPGTDFTQVLFNYARTCTSGKLVKLTCMDFECGLMGTDVTTRIVNGIDAPLGSFPWQVSLRRSDDSHVCGGAIISRRWITTAAHCVLQNDVVAVKVGYVDDDVDSDYLQEVKVESTHYDDRFDMRGFSYDFGLIRLAKPLTINSFVRSACLPPRNLTFQDGDYAYITGWGLVWQNMGGGGMQPSILQYARIPIIPDDACKFHVYVKVDSMICLGYRDYYIGACYGDSGGPLSFLGEDGRYYVIGATNFGFTCGGPRDPPVYARVTSYYDWMERIMGADFLELLPP